MKDMIFQKRLENAVDTTLASLDPSARECDLLIENIKGGTKSVMGKKVSAMLVFAIVMMILCIGTAFAIELIFGWRSAGSYMNKEENQGLYYTWPNAERVAFVTSLIKDDLIEASSDTVKLQGLNPNDKEAGFLADSIVTGWIKRPKNQVGVLTVLEKMWGEFRYWTIDQKAWFSQIMAEAGALGEDTEVYLIPDSNTISRHEAELAAKETVESLTGLQPGFLEEAAIISEYVKWPNNDEPVWFVEIYSEMLPEGCWYIEIDPITGDPIYNNRQEAESSVYDRPILTEMSTEQNGQYKLYSKSTRNYEATGLLEKYDDSNALLWSFEYDDPGRFVRFHNAVSLGENRTAILESSADLRSYYRDSYCVLILAEDQLITTIPIYQNENWAVTPTIVSNGINLLVYRGVSTPGNITRIDNIIPSEIQCFDANGEMIWEHKILDMEFHMEGMIFLDSKRIIAYGSVLVHPEENDIDTVGIVTMLDYNGAVLWKTKLIDSHHVTNVSVSGEHITVTAIDDVYTTQSYVLDMDGKAASSDE